MLNSFDIVRRRVADNHREAAEIPAKGNVDVTGGAQRLFRVARFVTAYDEGLCRAQSLSDEELVLLTSLPVKPEDPVTIAFSDEESFPGEVAWTERFRVGVRFYRTLDLIAAWQAFTTEGGADWHRPPRLPVKAMAIATAKSGLQIVRVLNMSQRGMRIAHDGNLHAGDRVKLKLESGVQREGVIRWSENSMAGVRLFKSIPPEKLELVSET